jgi:hypothetical protein
MKKELLSEYAKIQERIDALDAIKEALRDKIIKEIKKSPDHKEESKWGTFLLTVRPTWTYSPAVKTAEVKLKDLKEKEQKKGIATSVGVESLRFIPRVRKIHE